MAKSIELVDDIVNLARRESELQSRSVSGQVTHWARIGRAIEKSGNFDHARITAALSGGGIGLAASHAPADYWQIIGRENPRKDDAPLRLTPRRRKTAMGMRRDGASNSPSLPHGPA